MKQALADAIADRGYTTLTPVQEAVSNPEYLGADLLVSAQTGSGKTLGFGIAIAPTLLGEAESFMQASAPLALVIAPTRELALQVKRELEWLYAKAGATLASTVGGMDMRDERRALSRGAHIVVATPGRLRDHIMRGSIDLSSLRAVVLDEADEMLDLGFREDLEFILSEAPETRQTLLFSATVPKSITHLAKSYQKDAIRVSTKSDASQHADIEYLAMAVSERDHENAVINTLRFHEAPNAIVFCNTRAMVGRLTSRLSNRGFKVVALSGELSQQERTNALQSMRDGRARVCVATDVAARGIDLPNLDLVVHAELPGSHETLLHRSGRTGRAGRKGTSALIITPKVRKKALRILGMAKLTAQWADAPSAEAVQARDAERMLEDPIWQDAVTESEAPAVEKLTERFAPEQIAAAYLRLYATQHSAPEELSAVDEQPKPRQEFGASTWFSISLGRNQQAEPRRLLPMLCKAGGLSKDDIGAIRIQSDESFVQIRSESAQRFADHIGADMKVEGAQVKRLEGTPAGLDGPRPERPQKPRAPRKESGPQREYPPKKDYAPKKEYAPKKDYAPKPAEAQTPSAQAASAPTPKPAPKSAAPIDWDDAPAPRQKKPKPAAAGKKPYAGKPNSAKPPYAGKPKGAPKPYAKPARKDADPEASHTGAVKSLHRAGASDPSASMKGPRGRKGPPPPAGKPSSKKNRARTAGPTGSKGPDSKPRRPKF